MSKKNKDIIEEEEDYGIIKSDEYELDDDDINDEDEIDKEDSDEEDIYNELETADEETKEATFDDEATDIDYDIINPDKLKIFNTDNFIYENINKPHNTTKYLTKYEKIRAIGERANMLNRGAKTTLDYESLGLDIDNMTPIQIALLELKHKVLPFIIKRELPGKEPVYVSINDLIDIVVTVNE